MHRETDIAGWNCILRAIFPPDIHLISIKKDFFYKNMQHNYF